MNRDRLDRLRDRFVSVWQRCGGDMDPAKAWQVLDNGYADAARAYHGWDHVDDLLNGLDAARKLDEFGAVPFDAVELAIFFHDVVYDPLARTNEADSAALFQTAFGDAPDARFRDHVRDLVLATATHTAGPDPASPLMLDLDLKTLGASPQAYRRYFEAVREEYASVPDASWRAGRAAVMQRFLDRPRIYQTEHFFGRLERQARANIAAEIASLEGGGDA